MSGLDISDNIPDEANGNSKQNGYFSNQNKSKRTQYINFAEEDQMQIIGYTVAKNKTCITWIFYILTLGLLRLVYHWVPHWELLSTHKQCSLKEAKKVLIIDNYKGKFKSYFVEKVRTLTSFQVRDNLSASLTSIISFNGQIYSKKDDHYLTVYLNDGSQKHLGNARMIKCKELTYIWDEDKLKFIKLIGLDKNVTNKQLHSYKGYSIEEQTAKRITYGPNEIFVPVQSVLKLLLLEALTPFYMFQLFSLLVWIAEQYYYYTIAIIIMSLCGISTSIIQARKNQKNLKGTVHARDKIRVCRGGDHFQQIPTTDLVPGDLIEIPSNGCEILCDAVLLNGSCIVNESMLTGESVPITKTSLPDNEKAYNVKEDVNHTLYCGTRVIQTRCFNNNKVLAVVIRTGYLTTKGELVRSILYPPPADFKFDQDSYKFIGILAVIAILGFIYTIASKASRMIPYVETLVKALDLITIAIPPALPAAMTVGKLYALHRLKKKKVFCINSRIINVTGSINCICFDKTGTLTEDGLDLWGVAEIANQEIRPHMKDTEKLPQNSPLFKGMLTCHSLTIVKGEVCGDPLDVKMFESTGWNLYEPGEKTENEYGTTSPVVIRPPLYAEKETSELAILHQFQFVSKLQRMSVITKTKSSDYLDVYVKGSPEMIMSLSRPDTLPFDIERRLCEYTAQGYRVIGMATKEIRESELQYAIRNGRDVVEKDLRFVGLIIFENSLKPQTKGVISTLKEACLRVIMVTGDNIQTAVSVAKECKMVDNENCVIELVCTKPSKFDVAQISYRPFFTKKSKNNSIKYNQNGVKSDIELGHRKSCDIVITGTSWANMMSYFPNLVSKVVTKGVVFARMSGQQKQQLIEELQNLGYYVAMCGDGSNDCSALKAAHVGISLSEADASVASPFTSKEPNISCVPKVIREGRAALVTSFGVFKFMLCYSLIEFSSAIILYTLDNNLTSLQYLFIDVCLVLVLASFLGKTRASKSIHTVPPMTSLLTFVPLTSIVLFMFCNITAQVIALEYIKSYWWFESFEYKNSNVFASYENYAVFCVSTFQYIGMAVVFSKGEPYRRPIYTNKILVLIALILSFICGYITIYPATWLAGILELKLPPFINPRLCILILAAINFIVCLIIEDFIVDYFLKTKLKPQYCSRKKSTKSYLKVIEEIDASYWPFSCGLLDDECDEETVILNDICEYPKVNHGGKNGFCNGGLEIEETNFLDNSRF